MMEQPDDPQQDHHLANGRRCTKDGHSQVRGCPDWCVECDHDHVPEGAFWHAGPDHQLTVYGESAEPLPATVRASYFDYAPGYHSSDPAELTQPFVRFEVPDDNVDLSLTPTQARQLAAALNSAAATAEIPRATAAV